IRVPFHLTRDHGKKQVGLATRLEVQRVGAAEDFLRAVARVVVNERADAALRVADARDKDRLAGRLVVAAAHGESKTETRGYDDARGPDLDVELHRFAGSEFLGFIVAVPGPVRQALLRVELALRGAQPAEADRHARVVRALEGDLFAVGIEHAQREEDIGVVRVRGEIELRRHRAGDLHRFLERDLEQQSVTLGLIWNFCRSSGFAALEARLARVQVEARPAGALERPLVLVAQHELLAGMADLELDARLLGPAGILALEEVAEEAPLQPLAVAHVEIFPMRAAVRLEPLVARGGAHEALEVAARVQPLPAPVGGREERRLHLRPVGRARAAVLIVERMLDKVGLLVDAVRAQLFVGDPVVAAHRLAGRGALRTALAEPVLHALHGAHEPVGDEARGDAAMAQRLAIVVARAFPGAEGGEVRRLQGRHLPRVHRVVRDAVQAHLPVRPRLRARPLDAVVEVLRLARRPRVERARRGAGAARIDAHDGVALGGPLLGVDHLPGLVAVGRAFEELRVRGDEALPGRGVAFLESVVLAVRTAREDHRIARLARRQVDVGAQLRAVVHRDRLVPEDAHQRYRLKKSNESASARAASGLLEVRPPWRANAWSAPGYLWIVTSGLGARRRSRRSFTSACTQRSFIAMCSMKGRLRFFASRILCSM